MMDEMELRNVCDAALLTFDLRVLDSLEIIEKMMEHVASSELCLVKDHGATSSRTSEGELREDKPAVRYTREEMLSNSNCRRGDYTAVPKVIHTEERQ